MKVYVNEANVKKQLREIYSNMTEGIRVKLGFSGLQTEKTYKAHIKL